MRRPFLIALVGVVYLIQLSESRGAGSNAAEEAAIRRSIAAGSFNPLPDHVFWSGAYRRPTVGIERSEFTGGPASLPNRVLGSQRSTTTPLRIVVADSRDLAYEYSRSTLEYDLKGGEHRKVEVGVLRVWQKVGGEWREAASFERPYDKDFLP
jgi:hypothetical protein